jgi:hypothetical protein
MMQIGLTSSLSVDDLLIHVICLLEEIKSYAILYLLIDACFPNK